VNTLRDVIAGLVTALLVVAFLMFGIVSLLAAARWVVHTDESAWPICQAIGLWAVSGVLLGAWAATLARR
jgi:hypothetical protein